MLKLKALGTLLLVFLLAACGGGGGSPGSNGSGGGGGGSSSIGLGIYDSANTQVSSISVGGGYVARATVPGGAGKLVTFSLGGAPIAALTPTTALTNSSGVAEVSISPLSITSIGAASLSASTTIGTTVASNEIAFAVAASRLTLSPIILGASNLPSGGNTSLSVTALIDGVPSTGVPVNVNFSASCGRINGSDSSAGGISVTTNGSGVASAAYTAVAADGSLCSGQVTISASSVGATARTTSIGIAVPIANAITFVNATPAQIFVAGSGALEQSLAKFKVLSSVGTPLAGVEVVFSIATNPGGVGLNASGSTANVVRTTDQAGEVSVSLFSGTIPGPVKVRAALSSNPAVFAESQNLTVASGPPSQRFMSLSVEKFNIEGWNVDGTPTKLTVRLADRQGNAVEDGTVVNFTAEGGQVARSCATAQVNGISLCSVDFVSQNPRPAGGRVSVLAYTNGTKDYDDLNGNNRYDPGVDNLIQIGDAFRDDNESNLFDFGEFIIPRGAGGACADTGAAFPGRGNTCDAGLATTIRQQTVILYSSSSPTITGITKSAASISFMLGSADNPLLPMPAGTTISASSTVDTCTAGAIAGTPVVNVAPLVGNPLADLKQPVTIPLKGCVTGNVVIVKITSPGGLISSINITL